MNIHDQINQHCGGIQDTAKPYTMADLEIIAQGKADAAEGKEVRSNNPLYVEAYSIEKSCNILKAAS